MNKKVLLTGGAGYIGSHTCIELLNANFEIKVIDNFINSTSEVIKRIESITQKRVNFECLDVLDFSKLENVMFNFRPDCIVHFAGLKSVSESFYDPIKYYEVNVGGTINLLKIMEKVNCQNFIFSSTAALYDQTVEPPFDEDSKINPTSPYGKSKFIAENILKDWVNLRTNNAAVILRYFNPVGAHDTGLIGENPSSTPNNLMPLLINAAYEKSEFTILGGDFDTRDGTGERDFIHVCDLAQGHLNAINFCALRNDLQVFNLGTGAGTTVRELIKNFEKSNNQKISHQIKNRRIGDVDRSFANVERAKTLLDFKCTKTIEDMCVDSWNWKKRNPNGLC